MKKVLALVLTFALVFSTLGMAFADTTTPTTPVAPVTTAAPALAADTQSCVTVGMLKGATGTVDAAYAASVPTRIQSAIMFLRLKGLEADALAFTGTDNFADADKAAWAKPVMAYLKANPTLGWIGDGTNFDPAGALTAQAYYKVMLEALGYKQNTAETIGDFTWTGVVAFAKTVGLEKAAAATPFTVDNMATATVEALKANVKGGLTSLSATLVTAGKLDMTKAVTAGVYVAPNVDMKVDSITALNFAEIAVQFTAPVDAATIDVANIEVDGTALDENNDDNATLQADGKTVVVFYKAKFANAQQQTHKISISGVKSTAGKLMTAVDNQDVKFADLQIPSLVSVTPTGNKKLVLLFSEAVDHNTAASKVYSNYKVDGKLLVGDATKSITVLERKVTIYLASSLTAGEHTMNFANDTIKDYAGFSAVGIDTKFTVTEDKTLPTVAIISADQKLVKLQCSKELDLTNAKVYWMNGLVKKSATLAKDSDDKTIVKATFSQGNALPLYATTLTVEGGKDYFGNLMAKADLQVTATADITRPEVVSITPLKDYEETKLVVKFSEDVDDTKGTYTVKDADDSAVPVTKAYNTDTDGSDIKDEIVLTGTFDNTNSPYTVTVKNVEDLSYYANKSLEKAITVATPDVTDPSIVDVNKNDAAHEIYVTFDEAMDANTVGTLSNYTYETAANVYAAMPSGTTIAVSAGNKLVTLTLPVSFKVAGVTKTFINHFETTGPRKLMIKNATDVAGNEVATTGVTVADITETVAAIVVNGVTARTLNTVRIQLDGGVLPEAVYAGDFYVEDSTTHVQLTVTGASLDTTNKRIVLTLADDLNTDGTTGTLNHTVTVETVASVTTTKTPLGTPLLIATEPVGDKIRGSIDLTQYGAVYLSGTDEATLVFDEDLTAFASGTQSAASFKVRNDDGDLLVEGAAADYTMVATGDNTVVLTYVGTYTGGLTIELTNNTFVKDANGNLINDFSAVDLTNDISN